MTTNGGLIFLMGFLFLFLGYMGVPVAFALIASVLVVTAFTPVSLASMMAQLFNGMDTEALLAVPFFLLVGDLMTSANVTVRMITLSQTMVGHLRGGLAQVVTIFSMFFAGVSGSSAADVAVLSRTLAPEMRREGYDLAFTAALIASASTMANLIPPSIMAVVYGATGNVSIGGLFLGGVAPGDGGASWASAGKLMAAAPIKRTCFNIIYLLYRRRACIRLRSAAFSEGAWGQRAAFAGSCGARVIGEAADPC